MKRWTGYCLYWKLHTHNILLLILETSTKASAQKNASLCVAGEASNKGQKQTAQNVGGQSAPNLNLNVDEISRLHRLIWSIFSFFA